MRKFWVIALLFLAVSFVPAFAANLEPIPEGADIVVFVNNHANLPLGNLLSAGPLPPPVKQKIEEFFAATSFNPLKDITRVQLMVKKGASKREDNAVFVLSGTFNKDKIMAFIKDKLGQAVDEEKYGTATLYKAKDEKGGLCFLDNSKVALGTLPAVKTFIDAAAGKDLSDDYTALTPLVGEKAYAVLMIGGKEMLAKEMAKNAEKRAARREKMNRPAHPVAQWLENYLTEGTEPQGIFAQLLDNKFEVKVFYNRGDVKNNTAQASVEINDPKLTISKMFGELLTVLAELPAHEPKPVEKAPAKSPDKW